MTTQLVMVSDHRLNRALATACQHLGSVSVAIRRSCRTVPFLRLEHPTFCDKQPGSGLSHAVEFVLRGTAASIKYRCEVPSW